LVAAVSDGYHSIGNIYTSTNSGITWTLTGAPTNHGYGPVASSADGNKLVAAASDSIYTSTNSGLIWRSSPISNCVSLASSAEGTKLVAVTTDEANPFNGKIYTSTNSGMAWTRQTNIPNQTWCSIVASADGTKLVVQASSNAVYRSTDSGFTWTQMTPPPVNWPGFSSKQVVSSSADGTELVAALYGDQSYNPCPIYISTNSGSTWTSTTMPNQNWSSVACSADGTKIVAAAAPYGGTGPLYTSTNSGASWTSNSVPNQQWTFVASSADGNKLVAVSGIFISGAIYTLQTTLTPQMNIAPTNGNFNLSWIVPSTNFVLQQSPDLSSWSDLTNQPILNLTNLQNEVTLPFSGGVGFYRLKTP
jgi:hypothetical protein